jgi:hypothetical protein
MSYAGNLGFTSSCAGGIFYHSVVVTILCSSLQENMARMLLVTDVQDIIKRHQAQIITSLKDPDIRF